MVEGSPLSPMELGESEEGRPIVVWRLGHGPIKVSLLGGCHSDEPLGPHVLRVWLSRCLGGEIGATEWLDRFTFFICPHINPDGESRNLSWIEEYPNLQAYRQGAFREKPGRDVEFGFPKMRTENVIWAEAMKAHGPFDLHMSLHGMAYSEGFLLLIERHAHERCRKLMEGFRSLANDFGFGLHDHDRGGDKGFQYYGPGFTSTPEGEAMRRHFQEKDDIETASAFHLSSMEWIRSLGGNPICLVSELPLFAIQNGANEPKVGVPYQHMSFRESLQQGKDVKQLEQEFCLEPLGVKRGSLAMLSIIDMALDQVFVEKELSTQSEPD